MIIDSRSHSPESSSRNRTDLLIAAVAVVVLLLLVAFLPEASVSREQTAQATPLAPR